MLDGRASSAADRMLAIVLTGDAEFEQTARSAFSSNGQMGLTVIKGSLRSVEARFESGDASVVIVDLDGGDADEIAALQRLMGRVGRWPPVVAVTQAFDSNLARRLVRLRVADILVKPIPAVDLLAACKRAVGNSADDEIKEAQIYTFLPAAGGVGVTTLSIECAMTLMKSGPRGGMKTCLVDLNFQNSNSAAYLDLEPRLDLNEIEPRPERLDRQMLEVMLSHHSTGLAVIAAMNRPAEERSPSPSIVTRLLDLVSSQFDFVVIDMPRTWLPWTDDILRGSNKLFIVSGMTVPNLRYANQLVAAISERLGQGVRPQVVVNCFEQSMFGTGLRHADIRRALGAAFIGSIPNDHRMVREAIDRGVPLEVVKPRNKVGVELKKIVLQKSDLKSVPAKTSLTVKGWSLFGAR
jgi:pilus assembly protein CpaE